MKSRIPILALFALLTLSLAACTSGTQPSTSGGIAPTATPTIAADPTPPSAEGEGTNVYIDSIDILTLESFPVQINARVKGNLPDACTTIGSASSQRDGNTFKISIVTNRPAGAMCAQMLVPFEQNVKLDVMGLKAGTYTVRAGEVTQTFDLPVDNVLPTR